jgi:hypothetical protein
MLFGMRQVVSYACLYDNKERAEKHLKEDFARATANFLLDKIKLKEKETDMEDMAVYELRGVVISEKSAYKFLDLLKDRGFSRDFVIAEFKKLINEKEI